MTSKQKRFLLAVDGSECSLNAARFAIEMAAATKASVELVTCYDKIPAIMTDSKGKYLKEFKSLLIAEANKILDGYDKILSEAEVEHTKKVVEGSPGRVIKDLAKSKKYDLVIMGSRGHSEVGGLFMGSVSRKVLTNVVCPVLIVP